MTSLLSIIAIYFLALQPPQDDASEQSLRAVKALAELHKTNLQDACVVPMKPGDPPDFYHEELALRVALMYDDGAGIATRLGTERGRSAAVHMHKDAARHRLQAYACNPLRNHLEQSRIYVVTALMLADGGAASPATKQELEQMSQEIASLLLTHDAEVKRREQVLLTVEPVKTPRAGSQDPEASNLDLTPPKRSADNPDRKLKAARSGLAVSGVLTGLLLGASLGMGLSRVREPFEGAAHRAIYDAAVASWHGGENVPHESGDALCQQGRNRNDAGVIQACDNFDRLGRATVATGALAGVALATTVVFAIRFGRRKAGQPRMSAGWSPGGISIQLTGQF